MTPADSPRPASGAAPAAPVLRVVNPDATPEEVAAIVAVLSALGGEEPAPAPTPSLWASPARAARRVPGAPVPPGRGGWRASGLPH